MKIKFSRKNRHFWLLGSCLSLFLAQACGKINQAGSESQGVTASHAQISAKKSEKKYAKNLILFIGDGMGMSTITAARIFDGQSKGLKGEEHTLAFEDFENIALIKNL